MGLLCRGRGEAAGHMAIRKRKNTGCRRGHTPSYSGHTGPIQILMDMASEPSERETQNYCTPPALHVGTFMHCTGIDVLETLPSVSWIFPSCSQRHFKNLPKTNGQILPSPVWGGWDSQPPNSFIKSLEISLYNKEQSFSFFLSFSVKSGLNISLKG